MAFIDAGSFGRVYQYGNDKVIKVYFTKDLQYKKPAEKRVADFNYILRKFDPKGNYFLTYTEQGTASISELFNISNDLYNDVQTEKNLSRYKKNPKLKVQYKLYPLIQPIPNFKHWNADQIRHFLRAIDILHTNKICHNDLHWGNVGLKNNMPVLLDLDTVNFCNNAKDMYNDVHENIFDHFGRSNEKPPFFVKRKQLMKRKRSPPAKLKSPSKYKSKTKSKKSLRSRK